MKTITNKNKVLNNMHIPNGWNVSKFSEYIFYQEGPGLRRWQFTNQGIKVVNVTNLVGEFLDLNNTDRYISFEEVESKYKHFLIDDGDILIASSGNSWGKISVVRKCDLPLLMNTSVIRFKTLDERKLKKSYLLQYLKSDLFRDQISLLITGSAQPNFGPYHLERTFIVLPNIMEQEKIAEILSTWDLAIDKQEQLIEKKKEFKKGLMQRLLSGEVRFKEFNDKWKTMMIEDVADSISELNKSNEELVVLSCTKYDGLVESLKYFGKQMFSDDISKYKKVWKNDFVYATNHIEEGSIGVQRICDIGLVSPMYTVFRVNDEIADIDYLFYLLKTERYISIYKSRMSASVDRRGSLRWSEFSKIRLMLPSIHEQKKISEVLKTVDKEIELLEKELEALKLQKKGLIQRLLTGEVRVKI